MRHIAVIVALACLASTPVFAKPKTSQLQNFSAANAQQDPYGVYVDGQLIGRDPDPNVRASIRAAYCGKFAPVGGAK
jgi:hypothetical protein